LTSEPEPQDPLTPPQSDRIPRTVWALGFVSLFMDVSSEIIHSLLPVFLVTALGASAEAVGLIEGVAEATAMITRVFSGALSDWLGKRKALAVAGYGLAALCKPFFAMASGVGMVFGARFFDRIGKGVRGAPRDALIADVTPEHLRGAAYGLRQSLDTTGAFLGPLLAILLMALFRENFRTVFWVAFLPALVAVSLLVFAVKEPKDTPVSARKFPFGRAELAELGRGFWWVLAVGAVFTLARFSEAFLLLRGENVGLKVGFVPVILVVMNIVYTLTAYPVGHLSDRIGRTGLMAMGLVVLIGSDLVLALAGNVWLVLAGASLWGLHLGLTQGLLSALVADAAGPQRRGTAFGVFSLVSGVALLLASLLAGWLWESYGAPATFFAGAALAVLALAGFFALRGREKTAR
jgi:MFS family permease